MIFSGMSAQRNMQLDTVGQLVEALRNNPEGRGFDFRLYHWNSLNNPSGRSGVEFSL